MDTIYIFYLYCNGYDNNMWYAFFVSDDLIAEGDNEHSQVYFELWPIESFEEYE